MRRPSILLSVLLLAAIAVACSSGSDESGSDGAGPYVDAIVESFVADPTSPWDEPQARCMAEGIVDVVGVAAFEEAGLTPEDLTGDGADVLDATIGEDEDQATAAATAMVACFDSPGAFVVSVLEGAAPGEADEETVACVDDAVDTEAAVAFTRGLLLSDGGSFPPEVEALLSDLAAACPAAAEGFG